MNYHKPQLSTSKSVALESLKYPKRRRTQWSISYRVVAPIAMICDAFIIVLMGVLGSTRLSVLYSYDSIVGRSGEIIQRPDLLPSLQLCSLALERSEISTIPPSS